MFKRLFNKKEEVVEATNGYPVIVQKIHKEFNCAADNMLAEANKILAEAAKKDVDKGLRLKSLGFTSAQQVKETEETIKTESEARRKANIVTFYQMKYPLYKFITEEGVETICKKYGLVHGSLDLYKGFVPAKNLTDIENFVVRSEDLRTETVLVVNHIDYYSSARSSSAVRKIQKYLDENNNTIITSDRYFNRLDLAKLIGVYEDSYVINHVTFLNKGCDNKMSICASPNEMNLKGKSVDKKGKVFEVFKRKEEFVDPVVLQKVKNGYLIVTAWGDEASDPLVVNNKFN